MEGGGERGGGEEDLLLLCRAWAFGIFVTAGTVDLSKHHLLNCVDSVFGSICKKKGL